MVAKSFLYSTWLRCRSSFEVQVALKLFNSQDLRDTPNVNNGGHIITVVVVLISSFGTFSCRSKVRWEKMKVVSFHLTTESFTSTSLMTTRNLCAMCPNLKNNNNEHLPVDRWEVSSSSAPEWTRQAWMGHVLRWMGYTSVSCLMDACILASALMQH